MADRSSRVAVTQKRDSNQKRVVAEDGGEIPYVGVATELRLISVDDVAETFKCSVLVHTHFEDPSVQPDNSAPDEWLRAPDYRGFVPEIVFINIIDSEQEDNDIVVRVNRHLGVVWASFKNTFDINESLELQAYPFDRQLFRVQFKSPNSVLEVWSLQDVSMLDFPNEFGPGTPENRAAYLVSCELNTWRLKDIEVSLQQDDPDPVSLTSSEYKLSIMAERDPWYNLTNQISVIWMIVLLNVVNVAVSPNETFDRLALSATLFLTLTAFRIVLTQALPRYGYTTYMDRYVQLAFFFAFAATLESVIIAPRTWCLSELRRDDVDGAAAVAALQLCQEDETPTLTKVDLAFWAIYLAAWMAINIFAAMVCKYPAMLQLSWKKVMASQIGETESSIRRVDVDKVRDGDAEREDPTVIKYLELTRSY